MTYRTVAIKHSTMRLFSDDCIIYRQILSDKDTCLLQEDIKCNRELGIYMANKM